MKTTFTASAFALAALAVLCVPRARSEVQMQMPLQQGASSSDGCVQSVNPPPSIVRLARCPQLNQPLHETQSCEASRQRALHQFDCEVRAHSYLVSVTRGRAFDEELVHSGWPVPSSPSCGPQFRPSALADPAERRPVNARGPSLGKLDDRVDHDGPS